eukprot:TRINITY_DN73482_c0_g1_i1.p1 TRINITY_DN73482_c0_g1~~TRINITY_DN73482_c0_g1_i1.p1  ORF type:complete len:104 (-),score=9.40 TRINITY_DN73482_c0_g1_i1:123-434(-)
MQQTSKNEEPVRIISRHQKILKIPEILQAMPVLKSGLEIVSQASPLGRQNNSGAFEQLLTDHSQICFPSRQSSLLMRKAIKMTLIPISRSHKIAGGHIDKTLS